MVQRAAGKGGRAELTKARDSQARARCASRRGGTILTQTWAHYHVVGVGGAGDLSPDTGASKSRSCDGIPQPAGQSHTARDMAKTYRQVIGR